MVTIRVVHSFPPLDGCSLHLHVMLRRGVTLRASRPMGLRSASSAFVSSWRACRTWRARESAEPFTRSCMQ